MAGYCREHYDEHVASQRLETLAVETLHSGHYAHVFADDALKKEFWRLQDYWRRACQSVNTRIEDRILKDEAEFATSWCISLTRELILADEALKAGQALSYSLEYTRGWVWDRFKNLEAGLKSNGVAR